MAPSPQTCAAELLEVVPLIMRAMRSEVRRHRAAVLSMPQFRALAFIGRNEGAALSDVANFLGLTLPSASKLVDGLVGAKFVVREVAAGDRRRVHLALSSAGHARYKVMLNQARSFLAQKVGGFNGLQLRRLHETLTALRSTFETDPPAEVGRLEEKAVPNNGASKRVSKTTPSHD